MLKSCTLAVTVFTGRFGHISGTYGHTRGYILSFGQLKNDFGWG